MNFLIMGLPKSGKSALFNTLTKSTRQDMYSDVRIGTVKVPDKNLDKASEWHDTEKKVNGEILINFKKFIELNNDIKIDLINQSIKQLKSNYYDLRSKKVENLIKSLDKKEFKKSTLGGCVFFKKGEDLCVKVEKH